MDPQQTQQFVHAFLGVYLAFIIIVFVVKVALYAIPMWRICKRAGIAPQLSLICAIPVVGRLITTYIIAYSDWKVTPTKELYPGLQPFTPAPPPPTSYPPPPPTQF